MDLKDKIEQRRREREHAEKTQTETKKLEDRKRLDLAIDTLGHPNPIFPSPISKPDAQYALEKAAHKAVLPWSALIVIVGLGCSVVIGVHSGMAAGLSLFVIISVLTVALHIFFMSLAKKDLMQERQAKRVKNAR